MSPGVRSPELTKLFLRRWVGFLDRVRLEGVGVGTGAGLDLGLALAEVPLLDRSAVGSVCEATLAKSPKDLDAVRRAFEAFWGATEPAMPEGHTSADGPPRSRPSGPAPRRAPTARVGRPPPLTSEGELPLGVYSATAPPPGHPLPPVDARTMAHYRAAARRFRQECATLPGRRRRAWAQGDIDLPTTARRAVRTAGEWVDLAHQAPRLRRADLVILWDVSGSMREHDGPLFGLIYALKRLVRSTRIYVFSTDLYAVTSLVSALPYSRALAALSSWLETPAGGTQIAASLRQFRRTWGATVRPTTTVLVLSDGWDLGDAAELTAELLWLGKSAHELIWVNPYAGRPGFAPTTSGMQAAASVVDRLSGLEHFPAPGRVPRTAVARVSGAGKPISTRRAASSAAVRPPGS